MVVKLDIDGSELLALKRQLETLGDAMFGVMKGDIDLLGQAVIDSQAAAIMAGLDLEGGTLKPNTRRYAEYKLKKFGTDKPLVRQGVLSDASRWFLRPYTRRGKHQYYLTVKEPRERGGVTNFVKMRGYDKSFGLSQKENDNFDRRLHDDVNNTMDQALKARG
jgi:hypothetical protein